MSDHYDQMDNEQLERVMKIRGWQDKIQWFRDAPSKRQFLRDDDYDRSRDE